MKVQARKRTARSLSSVVKIGASRQVIIPKKIHDRLGLEPGDFLEVKLDDDRVVLTPQVLVEKRLAEAFADLRNGRVHGPFASTDEMIRTLHRSAKARA